MKKSGFTLSELLVALSIIAIASAMIAPAVSNFMPDKNKTRVLKYYSTVKNYTSEMLDNEGLYYYATDFDENNMPFKTCPDIEGCTGTDCLGLNCTSQAKVHPYTDETYSGTHKYRNLLSAMISGTAQQNFTLSDGSEWNITEVDQNDLTKGYRIRIDMNSGGNDCSYSANCKKPDYFIFKVTQFGDVEPGDALTAAFLRNPDRTSKKKDLENAATIVINDEDD